MHRYWLTLLLLGMGLLFATAQTFTDRGAMQPHSGLDPGAGGGLTFDAQADQWIRSGKVNLREGRYDLAAQVFDNAARQPLHQGSTLALYYSGLAYFYQNNTYLANQRFDQLILNYPQSRYLDDAIYHKAVISLRSQNSEQQLQGLNDLFFLVDRSPREDVRQDAYQSARQFMFYLLSPQTLQSYTYYVADRYQTLLAEAICYRYIAQNQESSARQVYQNYLNRGGFASPLLLQMFSQRQALHYFEPNVMKIGLFLPLFLNQTFSSQEQSPPVKSKLALEFYEGFEKAVSDFQPYSRKKIFLKVYDTLRDSVRIRQQLAELESYSPDLVVGEIFNPSSRVISAWARSRGVPQVVPLSPTLSTAGQSQLFLAHPSVATHGRRLAEYALQTMGLSRITVWTDNRRITQEITQAFIGTFRQLGGTVTILQVDSSFAQAKAQILQLLRSPGVKSMPGHFIPLPSEEACGLILSELQYQRIQTRIIGTPEWRYFEAIDQDLKEEFGAVFSTSYFLGEENPQYQAFFAHFLKQYGAPPTEYHIQGYDLGRYLLQLLDRFDYRNGLSLSAYLRQYGLYRGVHLDYYFGGAQDNQRVHICEFRNGGVVKVNNW